MKREAYPAARTVSPKLHTYFARHRAEAIGRGQSHLAPLPEAETIEAVIDAAFWASLRREEGYVPRISLAYPLAGRGFAPSNSRSASAS